MLGNVPAMLWVIEFQKRGLPHAHILVILANEDRVNSSSDINDIIWAQLPTSPDNFKEGTPERDQAERLEKIILTNMVHGPCGKDFSDSPCMKEGKCSKNYPKRFCDKTILDPDNTHPEYQRLAPEKGGRTIVINYKSKEFVLDNRWIVPYSPYFSLRYNCHINVEVCLSPMAAKYLYKYVFKGSDRAMVRTEIVDEKLPKDEVEEYRDLRSIGSSEAAWHLFNFNIAKKQPAVYALRCHLEEEQQVVFDKGNEEELFFQGKKTPSFGHTDFTEVRPST